ncbi:hypothetical protein Tsubulata_045334, partial [Turnera subulata]
MSSVIEGKKKKKLTTEPAASISWQEKKDIADKEAEALEKEIEDLKAWTEMIDTMNDEQLREYLRNRPEELMTVKVQKGKPRKKVQRVRKSKAASASVGIMASVWKFHREEDGECSTKSDA